MTILCILLNDITSRVAGMIFDEGIGLYISYDPQDEKSPPEAVVYIIFPTEPGKLAWLEESGLVVLRVRSLPCRHPVVVRTNRIGHDCHLE